MGARTFRGSREEVAANLRALFLQRGVPEEVIESAGREDRLDLLAVDRLMLPSSHRHTPQGLFEAAGIDQEVASRLWRALGFPGAQESEDFFTDQDLEALRVVYGLVSMELTNLDTAVQLTRVMGSSMERLAEALVAATDVDDMGREDVGFLSSGEVDHLAIADEVAFASESLLPSVEQLIVYAWRRHIQAAVRRRVTLLRDSAGEDPHQPKLTIGFADMIGFTALSQQLSASGLAMLVDRFEAVAHDTVVEGGGRVVKMIGDEVMYATPDPRRGVGIALDLAEAYADDELLSDVRAGVATGPVLAREGDYFGAVVNRASRIVNIADAGTVLVSTEVHDAVADDTGLLFERLRPRELKDLGVVELYAVRRRDAPEVSDERRSGVRWRRFEGLRNELDAVRARGEAVLGSITAAHGDGTERGR